MAEPKTIGSSSYLIYLFFLGVILISTCCSGETHVAYDVANPSTSFVVSNIVSHPRFRRDVDVTQQTNNSVTPEPAENSSSIAITPAPSDGESSLNDTTNNSTNNLATQNGTTTAGPTTKQPPIIEDSKDYYVVKSNIRNFGKYWIELGDGATKHVKLSKSHRVAAVLHLGFKFPFYGHLVDNVTVATGGFIYMSPFLHQWLTATQYIAPLMANFDLSISSDSNIYYMSLEDSFHVEWRNVILQDQNDTGSFTFQVILNATGEITFVYKDVPLAVSDISRLKHPVKVGLSDAYYNDTYIPQLNMRRRTIYEYHRVSVDMERVQSKSVIILEPLPTCNTLNDCTSCTEHVGVSFNCQWCNTIGRCSDGLDWYRQHWDRYGCQRTKTANPAICQRYTTRPPVVTSTTSSSTSTSATVPASTWHSENASTTAEGSTTEFNQTFAANTSHETMPFPTTLTYTTASLPPSYTEKISPSQTPTTTSKPSVSSATNSTPSTHPSATNITEQPSHATSITTKKSTEITTSPTQVFNQTITTTTEGPTKTTTSTTQTSSPTTTITAEGSTKTPTSTTTEKPATYTSSTKSTTEGSTESTTRTTKKSSQPTTPNSEGPAQSSSAATSLAQSSSAATSLDNGGVAAPYSGRSYGICSNGKCGTGSTTPVAVIVTIIFLIAGLAAGIGGWVFYAYTHPTSRSGMWLMEHRPSQMKAKIQFWKSSSDSGAAKYKMESDA